MLFLFLVSGCLGALRFERALTLKNHMRIFSRRPAMSSPVADPRQAEVHKIR